MLLCLSSLSFEAPWAAVSNPQLAPLSSLPCIAVLPGGIAWCRITAVQRISGVWERRAVSAVAWSSCHLLCHWLQDRLPSDAQLSVLAPRVRRDHRALTGESGAEAQDLRAG